MNNELLFQEAARPLTDMLEARISRLERANERSLPFLLDDIEKLSDGIVSLEATFNRILNEISELERMLERSIEKSVYLEMQWKGTSEVMNLLKEKIYADARAKANTGSGE